ncbi:hypothetical protein FLACOL_00459 [Flavobacterium columnare]|uniref:Uncharacterized protein n=2 Tax=Flavobacterium TaxID=237 RepID=A0A2N9P804_9FLAO|nr:hypothetical protein FLACOL_00459 [Flavobacterium columnare]
MNFRLLIKIQDIKLACFLSLKEIIIFLFFSVFFLYVDTNMYYNGLGIGFVARSLPKRFSISLNPAMNGGFELLDNTCQGQLLADNSKNEIGYKNILVEKFVSYWYNDEFVLCQIIDNNKVTRFILFRELINDKLEPSISIKELSGLSEEIINLNYGDQTYMNLKYVKFENYNLIILKVIYLLLIVLFAFFIVYKIIQMYRN